MWISSQILNQIVCNHEKEVKRADALLAQVVAISATLNETRGEKLQLELVIARSHANVEWMKHRINELVVQNAELLNRISGVRVPTAEIETVGVPRTTRNGDHAMNPFEDPEEAHMIGAVTQPDAQVQAEELLKSNGIRFPHRT